MLNRRFAWGIGICLTTILGVSTFVNAQEWSNWRGPHLNGTANPGSYPLEWGLEKNLRWQADLPGKSGSSPIVWNDKLLVTLPIDDMNGVICLNQAGDELWRKALGSASPAKHKKGSGANPSPVTDGKTIIVYYKSGDFAGLDWDGKILWHENLQTNYGEDTLWWDLGTSPVLTSKYVVVACMQTGPSYLAAFDKLTGKEVWKVDRNLDAPEEAAQSYSTPVVTTFAGQEQIVVVGADHVTCHDAETGTELWRVGGLNPDGDKYFRSIASPVIEEDIVIAPYARGKSLTAIKLGGSGDVAGSHVLWTKELGADVPTPAARDGKVYVCGDKGSVACLDVKTGDEIWSRQLDKNRNAYSSSPILAGDLLYLVREDATTFVVDSQTGDVKAENALGDDEFCISTPVLINNEIFLRTFDRLFCIESAKQAVSTTSVNQ
ncbi:PQQ-binding-like beta-propeller repeat protein [Planctomicrobium sp. SH661]|uniref:outer membrane protein assembly factor BamB family protein n=1 Tax=Planctomicrobium sp. SH661 TaxID=3448124 RepID=UPI003F5C2103